MGLVEPCPDLVAPTAGEVGPSLADLHGYLDGDGPAALFLLKTSEKYDYYF